MQEVCQEDLEAMAEVTSLLDQKTALLTELRAMNSAAASGSERDAVGRYSDDFQHRYACTVMMVRLRCCLAMYAVCSGCVAQRSLRLA